MWLLYRGMGSPVKSTIFLILIVAVIFVIYTHTSSRLRHTENQYPYLWTADVMVFRMNRVIASKSKQRNKLYDVFFTMGQFHKAYLDDEIVCCILHENSVVIRVPALHSGYTSRESEVYIDRYFVCPSAMQIPVLGVNMVLSREQCPMTRESFLSPINVKKMPRKSLAVYAHIAYGALDPELVIEWMEVHRYLGVSKVAVSVSKSLNSRTNRVLQYYRDTGFLDYVPYITPDPECKSLAAHTGSGKTLAVDFGERYRGYTYQGVLDLDEFLIPSNNRSLLELMDSLVHKYHQATAFKFKTSFHVSTFSKTNASSDIIIEHHQLRTNPPIFQAPKFFLRTDRLQYGGQQQKDLTSMPVGVRQDVNESEAYIHHFRQCRTNADLAEKFNKLCNDESVRERDTSMQYVLDAVRENILLVRKKVFGSEIAPQVPQTHEAERKSEDLFETINAENVQKLSGRLP